MNFIRYKVRHVIINADDLGYSSSTNRAIFDAFKQGLISSATLMPNGEAYEEACEFAVDNGLQHKIGLHITLTEGYPLTNEIKRCSRLCYEDGSFRKWDNRPWIRLNDFEKDSIYFEVKSQICKLRNSGFPVYHADSHHHIHTIWAIGLIIMRALREQKVSYLRLSRNIRHDIAFHKRLYKKIFNSQIVRNKLKTVDYFGSIDDFILSTSLLKNYAKLELMCHPRYQENFGSLIDLDGFSLTDKCQKVKEQLIDFAVVSYADLENVEDYRCISV